MSVTPPIALCIGEAMVELTTLDDSHLAWTFAGDTLNCAAAIAAAAPNVAVQYTTGIGEDAISAAFTHFAQSLRVDATSASVVAGRTLGLYWITTVEGERSFQYWRSESAARHALQSGVDLPAPGSVAAMELSGITLAVAGPGAFDLLDKIEAHAAAGAMVCVDVNYRSALWNSADEAREVLERSAGSADVVKASADDIRAVWGVDAREFCTSIVAAGASEVVVTDGPRPVLLVADDEALTITPPAVKPTDTTGAGDAFFGTYIGRRMRGGDRRSAAEAAVTVAAQAVCSPGALGYLTDSR